MAAGQRGCRAAWLQGSVEAGILPLPQAPSQALPTTLPCSRHPGGPGLRVLSGQYYCQIHAQPHGILHPLARAAPCKTPMVAGRRGPGPGPVPVAAWPSMWHPRAGAWARIPPSAALATTNSLGPGAEVTGEHAPIGQGSSTKRGDEGAHAQTLIRNGTPGGLAVRAQ